MPENLTKFDLSDCVFLEVSEKRLCMTSEEYVDREMRGGGVTEEGAR